MTFRELLKGDLFSIPRRTRCLFVKIAPVDVLGKDGIREKKNAVLVSGYYQHGGCEAILDTVGDLVDFVDNERVEPGRLR